MTKKYTSLKHSTSKTFLSLTPLFILFDIDFKFPSYFSKFFIFLQKLIIDTFHKLKKISKQVIIYITRRTYES